METAPQIAVAPTESCPTIALENAKAAAVHGKGLGENPGAVNVKVGSGEQYLGGLIPSNLVWIKTDLRARTLEEHLDKTITLFERRVARHSKQIREAHDEILRLVCLSLLSQVVLLLCVAQSNLLECRNLWTPLSLSSLASIITVRGVFQKYRTIGSLETILSSEEQTLMVPFLAPNWRLVNTFFNDFEVSSGRFSLRVQVLIVFFPFPFATVGMLVP